MANRQLSVYEKKLAEKLRYGDVARIAKKLGLHRNTVSLTINGGRINNPSVWQEVIKLIKKYDHEEIKKQHLAKCLM